jgi:transcriptional regulator with XRE-family HTH domain
MESVGKEIREVTKKKGISPYRIAKDVAIARESLHRSLRDDANPEWKRIKQILDYLGYEIVLKPKRKEVNPSELNRPGRDGKGGNQHGSEKVRK